MARTRLKILDGEQLDIYSPNCIYKNTIKNTVSGEQEIAAQGGLRLRNGLGIGLMYLNSGGTLKLGGESTVQNFLTIDSDGNTVISQKSATVTNLLTLQNYSSNPNVGVGIKINFGDGTNLLQASTLSFTQKAAWTATASTQNTIFSLKMTRLGTIEEKLKITENGTSSWPQMLNIGAISTAGVAGGSLGNSTTYFYVITYIDVFGNESDRSTETLFGAGAGNNSANITWNHIPSARAYKIYRSTTTQTYGATTLIGVSTSNTFLDIGGAAIAGSPPSINATAATQFSTSGTSWLGAGSVITAPRYIPRDSTDGFLYIPATTGTITGAAPTYYGQNVPLCFDASSNTLFVYNSGWVGVALA